MTKKNSILLPTFNIELDYWNLGINLVAGVDEVGRGAFAGPIVAASVIFAPSSIDRLKNFSGINDSKLLSISKREYFTEIIKDYCLSYAVSVVSTRTINKIGIEKANILAIKKAVNKLTLKPDMVIVDGKRQNNLYSFRHKHIVKGDSLSLSIAASSIIAKVYRDKLMDTLHLKHPSYSFNLNKGYGTKYHREQLKKYGLINEHRSIFNINKYL